MGGMGDPGMAGGMPQPMGGMPGEDPMGGGMQNPILDMAKAMKQEFLSNPSPENKMAIEAALIDLASTIQIGGEGEGAAPAPAGPMPQGPTPPPAPM
jgi:hypothetical protein